MELNFDLLHFFPVLIALTELLADEDKQIFSRWE